MSDVVADPRYGRGGMARHALIVMVMTVLSGLLGILRESVVAGQFGTGDAYAAYVAAFRLPNIIYFLVIGGALGSAFIPVFTAYLARRDDEGAWRLASKVLNLALIVAVIGAGLVFLLAPWLVRWVIAPGFPEQQQVLTVRLTRLLLLQPILLGLGGLAMATLNAFRRFLLTSLAPVIYNLGIIVGALFLAPYWGIDGLVVGVLVGAAAYLLLLVPGLFLCRMHYSFSFDWREPGVREVGRLLLPRILGQAAFQINFIAITALASLSGDVVVGAAAAAGAEMTSSPESLAVTAINYAYLLLNQPLSVLGVSLGTVVFPTLATLANEGSLDLFRLTLTRIVRVVLFLSLPLSALMFVLRVPIIHLLFERGEFTAISTEATAQAFLFFSLGLAAVCVTEIALRAFYALHDTRTPVIVGAIVVALNIGLGAALLQVMGFTGLVLSFTLTNSLETVVLLLLLRRRIHGVEGKTLFWSGSRSLGAAVLAAVIVALLLPLVEWLVPGAGLVTQLARLAGLTLLGGGVYLAALAILRSPELGEAWALVRRRLRGAAAPEGVPEE